MQFGLLDIFTVLLVTIGPLKALIIYASLTAKADADFRRQVAIKTVTTATIVTLVFVLAGEILSRPGGPTPRQGRTVARSPGPGLVEAFCNDRVREWGR
jgi:hypothetical protein